MADSFKELVLESKEFASQRRPLSFGRAAGDYSALNVLKTLEVHGSFVLNTTSVETVGSQVSPSFQVFL